MVGCHGDVTIAAPTQHRSRGLVMAVLITMDDVPEAVRDALMARAALRGQSLQQFLRCELARIASRPSGAWLDGVRKRKAVAGTRMPPSKILAARSANKA